MQCNGGVRKTDLMYGSKLRAYKLICDARRRCVECGQANTLQRGEQVDAQSCWDGLMSCTALHHRKGVQTDEVHGNCVIK